MLTVEEAARLENWGVWPSCKCHSHVSRTRALEHVAAETHRFVGGADTKVDFASAVVPVECGRIWSPVQCHDAAGRPLMGMRTWGHRPQK